MSVKCVDENTQTNSLLDTMGMGMRTMLLTRGLGSNAECVWREFYRSKSKVNKVNNYRSKMEIMKNG